MDLIAKPSNHMNSKEAIIAIMRKGLSDSLRMVTKSDSDRSLHCFNTNLTVSIANTKDTNAQITFLFIFSLPVLIAFFPHRICYYIISIFIGKLKVIVQLCIISIWVRTER